MVVYVECGTYAVTIATQELKASAGSELKHLRKQKKYAFIRLQYLCAYCDVDDDVAVLNSFSERYTRDLTATRRKLEECELKLAALDKQVAVVDFQSTFVACVTSIAVIFLLVSIAVLVGNKMCITQCLFMTHS